MKTIKDHLKSLTLMDVFVTLSVIVLFAIVIDQVGQEVIDTIQTITK
jgi:hypothetical protein